MGLPFKNGFELAKAMGFGKMYQASKQQQENDMQMESKKDNNLIRITEQDLHRMVMESVNKILNEVKYGGESLHGDNPEDWYAISAERAYRSNSASSRGEDNGHDAKQFDRDHENIKSLGKGLDMKKGFRKGANIVNKLHNTNY